MGLTSTIGIVTFMLVMTHFHISATEYKEEMVNTVCAEGCVINNLDECVRAGETLGINFNALNFNRPEFPPGCFVDFANGFAMFNNRTDGQGHPNAAPICRKSADKPELSMTLTSYDEFSREAHFNDSEGIVFVSYKKGSNDVLGTLCGNNFNDASADLICKSNGYDKHEFWTKNDYDLVPKDFTDSIGIGIAIQGLDCEGISGNEHTFENCNWSFETDNCTHADDIYMICGNDAGPTEPLPTEEPSQEPTDDSDKDECKDSGIYNCEDSKNKGQCDRIDFIKEHCKKTCGFCDDKTELSLRLVSYDETAGVPHFNDSEGLVFVSYKNGSSDAVGTLCETGFNDASADLICESNGFGKHSLWFRNVYDYVPKHFIDKLGVGIAIKEFSCDATIENANIQEHCTWSFETEDCSHDDDIYIMCNTDTGPTEPLPTVDPTDPQPTVEPTDDSDNDKTELSLRLVSYDETVGIPNFNDSEGLVFVSYKNGSSDAVGTLCGGTSFNDASADLICESNGFGKHSLWFRNVYDYVPKHFIDKLGVGIAIKEFSCDATIENANIQEHCTWSFETEDCSHDDDIYIMCNTDTGPTEPLPTVDPTDPQPTVEPTDDSDNVTEFRGFSLIEYHEKEGMRTGLSTGLVLVLTNGSETRGTLCDDGVADDEARFICRQLGYSDFIEWGRLGDLNETEQFVPMDLLKNARIALDELDCPWNATDIQNCSHNAFYESDCSHSEDVWLNCKPDITPNKTRLSMQIASYNESSGVPNFYDSEGLVLVQYEKGSGYEVGTLCGSVFNNASADLICKYNGFEKHEFWSKNMYDYVPKEFTDKFEMAIVIQGLDCEGTPGNGHPFEHCNWSFETENCSHADDIYIRCQTKHSECSAGEVKCPGGSGQCVPEEALCNGTAECDDSSDELTCEPEFKQFMLYEYNDTVGPIPASGAGLVAAVLTGTPGPGTLCANGIGYDEARFICRQLGYNVEYNDVVEWGRQGDLNETERFVPMNITKVVPIALAELDCPWDATDIKNCTHNAFYQNNCDHYDDLWLRCGTDDGTPEPSTEEPSKQPTEEYENGIKISFAGLNFNLKLSGRNFTFGWPW